MKKVLIIAACFALIYSFSRNKEDGEGATAKPSEDNPKKATGGKGKGSPTVNPKLATQGRGK